MAAEPRYTGSCPVPDRYAPPPRDESAAIAAVLAGGMLSGGAPVVADYEAALAARFGAAHAIAVNSGSSALHAALHVLGARPGTEVIMPATAPLPTAFPVLTTGATPVIADVAEDGLGLDPEDVARKLTPRTVAATLDRQSVLQRADPPEVVAVLHEMVLHRLIGSAEIMYDQLTHLADLSERPNISVHVVPSSIGAHAGLSGDISLASGDGGPDVLHTDAVPEGHTTESRSLMRRAAVTFERVRRGALPCTQSRDLILEVANEQWKQ